MGIRPVGYLGRGGGVEGYPQCYRPLHRGWLDSGSFGFNSPVPCHGVTLTTHFYAVDSSKYICENVRVIRVRENLF